MQKMIIALWLLSMLVLIRYPSSGLWVVDLTDPTKPVEVGSFDSGSFNDLTVVGELIYVAGGDKGLFIFRFEP